MHYLRHLALNSDKAKREKNFPPISHSYFSCHFVRNPRFIQLSDIGDRRGGFSNNYLWASVFFKLRRGGWNC